MADYRALRQRYSLLEICAHPELAVAVTLQPVDVIEVDAAILFSDLLRALHADGAGVRLRQGRRAGDRASDPDGADDVDRLQSFEPREALAHVLETIRLLRRELDRSRAADRVWRRALHAGGVRDRRRAVDDLRADQGVHVRAAGRVAPALRRASPTMMVDYLTAQVEAGVQALQMFDSWAGALGRADYREFAHAPHVAHLLELAARRAPRSISASARGDPRATSPKAGGDVIGVDWRLPLDEAWVDRRHGSRRSRATWIRRCCSARASGCSRRPTTSCGAPAAGPGHIFNLGHGILPNTPLETCRRWRATFTQLQPVPGPGRITDPFHREPVSVDPS